MVKTYNNIAEYAKKLLIEANPYIDEKDIYVTANTDIASTFRILKEKDLACIDTSGTEEIPLIHDTIYSESLKEKEKAFSKERACERILQGVVSYSCEGFTVISVRVINKEESPSEEDFILYAFTEAMYNRAFELAYKEGEIKYTIVPDNGVHRAIVRDSMMGKYLEYIKVEDIPSNSAIHQCKEDILKSAEFFFKNIPLFSRFGQKPLRKFLLCGEPGTGKTSICYDIAKEYQKDIPIVFVTDFDSLAKHISECAKVNKRTIVIFEDCEVGFRNSAIDSSILNFLDGIDRPNIQDGAIVIMTTNHPERIEARITKRPGRIDKLFFINALEGQSAIDVFNLYFGEFMKENNFDATTQTAKEAIEIIASGMTGAQIKELFNSYVCYMVSEAKDFNLNDVFNTKVELFKSFDDMDKNYNSIEANKEFDKARGKILSVLNR